MGKHRQNFLRKISSTCFNVLKASLVSAQKENDLTVDELEFIKREIVIYMGPNEFYEAE